MADDIITMSDILASPDGESLYNELETIFPYFSSIRIYNNFILITVAKGTDFNELRVYPPNICEPNKTQQFTYTVGNAGAYTEISYDEMLRLIKVYNRGTSFGKLGL